MQLLSVVTPVYNEEPVLDALFERLTAVFGDLDDLRVEFILVDDGSRDRSWAMIEDQHQRDPRFRGLRLSRNFGHQMALTAGMDAAAGDAVVVMDADLQDPPEVALEMVARWRAGAAVVYGQRKTRHGESFVKLATARGFYRIMQWLSPVPTPSDVGDFYLLDRRALDELKGMRERHRYLRGMVFWLGYPREAVPYERPGRQAGKTKFNMTKMLRFALDGMLSSSSALLSLASYIGLTSAALGLGLGVWAVWTRYYDDYVIGWASTVVIVLFLGGVQLATIGILGLYVGRIYDEAKRRPLYLVDRKHEPAD